MGLLCINFAKLLVFFFVFFDYDYKNDLDIKEESTELKVSVEMLQYMSTFFKFKKDKFVTKVDKRTEEKIVLCEDFSGNPSCLSRHCFDCFCTVYT